MIDYRAPRSLGRRQVLKSALAAPALGALAAASGDAGVAAAKDTDKGKGKGKGKANRLPPRTNILIFITDQQRATQHFPAGWERDNLPGMTRLKRNGVSFENAIIATAMCSPSRASLMTGYFPAQNGVKDSLVDGEGLPVLPTPATMKNLGTVMTAAGYEVQYRGKWHLTDSPTPADLAAYGFNGWVPPDGGTDMEPQHFGGGTANLDDGYVNGNSADPLGGAVDFLDAWDPDSTTPFCLIVCLVNPHDVLAYSSTGNWESGGYDPSTGVLDGEIRLPKTLGEKLLKTGKPTIQPLLLPLLNSALGELTSPEERANYVNFYGNLTKQSDAYLVQILDSLDANGLTDGTLVVQLSDHGEMGLAHGGLRQKAFNMYEETIRVPLIYSNPVLFSRARQEQALVSHVDLLPTLASLAGTPAAERAEWEGKDYARLVLGESKKPVQDYVIFTFDESQLFGGQTPPPPGHIVALREARYKIARYRNENDPLVKDQWEMYDLRQDPNELKNLAFRPSKLSRADRKQLLRLKKKLQRVEQQRLQPLA